MKKDSRNFWFKILIEKRESLGKLRTKFYKKPPVYEKNLNQPWNNFLIDNVLIMMSFLITHTLTSGNLLKALKPKPNVLSSTIACMGELRGFPKIYRAVDLSSTKCQREICIFCFYVDCYFIVNFPVVILMKVPNKHHNNF